MMMMDELQFERSESDETETISEVNENEKTQKLRRRYLPRREYKKLTRKFVIETLKSVRGNVTLAAQILHVSRVTIYSRLKKKDLDKIRSEAFEWRTEIALGHFDKALIAGERWAVEKQLDYAFESNLMNLKSNSLQDDVQLEIDPWEVIREIQALQIEVVGGENEAGTEAKAEFET